MSLRSLTASRRTYWVAGAVGALLAVALIMLATFPWGVLRETVERQASKQVGRPVTISRIERLDSFSFAPTIAIHDVVIPQAAWAGPGTLAHIVTARVRFSAWAVLIGRFEPLSVEIDGLRLALARDARHRVNWRKDGATPGGDDAAPKITHLILRDARVTYRDAFRQRSFDLTLSSDAQGFRVGGVGVVRGQSVRVTAHGPAVTQDGKPWPFQARIDGPALTMSARGAMDAPLDTHHMTIDVTARATNLNLVDAIIEAGLIETQPVTLAAHARRDGRDWNVSSVTGRIGQSDIAGHVTVHKADGRARLDGAIVADRLRFNDFSSNEGLAKAAALTRAEGEKLVPNLRINIAKIATTDGTIAFTVRHLVDNGGAGAFTGLSGRVTMDHQLMTVDPLRFTMQRGTMSGTLRVDQRGGRPVPIVTVDLAIRESSLGVIAGTAGGAVDGRFDARARLTGPGSTIREVVGNSDGTLGVVARHGRLPAKIASMIGFDAGRSLFTGGDEEAGLRCVALRLDLRHGIGRADPFVIDTTRSQSNGSGTITFPAETLALDMTGRPKDRIVLRLPGSLHIGGTIKQPEPVIPPGVKSVGNIFKAIGRAIRGDQGPLARDADCAGLARRVLQ
ncbi:AsmA family protein [Sphingomonas sp. AR_OL41]|uniref:AsmA family protein n=1 Tax=Sphingomonas sp. AR_OL41 TaxID=3042729 RepID=UPI0024813923|nr:AsmA family protein [Sphingomonas sp. AR_OL41]MDH7972700.1 AsmA family protein [Sphingomonas sp. AR_OL41]